ncbi:hypothetical protein [Flavobacterium granuli]|uniref:Response regulatory domain-containing protein n=1 Tax=Flavobacterium granuli TaxID=280093 RepID=A0ABU1S3U9_9FLAO|nr:hypothetical protein [Flavobacterium granuli]MDR6845706.1 hypothetical protein [Flavobacterium granuli]
MKKLEFLILGKNEPILEILLRLVNADEDWHAVGFSDEETAKDYFKQNLLDIVLLSSGIEAESEKDIQYFFKAEQPEIEIIEHYGGGSGLLKCEILEALERRRKRKLSEKQA